MCFERLPEKIVANGRGTPWRAVCLGRSNKRSAGVAIVQVAVLPASRRHPLLPFVISKEAAGQQDQAHNDQCNRHDSVATCNRPQSHYRPTTMIWKLPGTTLGQGWGFFFVGAGRGPNSAVAR